MQRKRIIAGALLSVGLLVNSSGLGQGNKQEPPPRNQFILVRLNDRKPMPNQHLVIFAGSTVNEARRHSNRIDLDTNVDGVVTLKLNPNMRWFQAWREVKRPCQKELDGSEVFDGSVLFDEGIIIMDTCGSSLLRLQPYFQVLPPIVSQKPK